MENEAIEVFVKVPVQHTSGYALFIGNDEKTIIIYVDSFTGDAIRMIQNGVRKERPLTHDLMGYMMQGFGIEVTRVLINDVADSTFFARLTLSMENELGKKIVEIDARPSDSITLALMFNVPIHILRHVFDKVEDMTEIMEKIIKQQK